VVFLSHRIGKEIRVGCPFQLWTVGTLESQRSRSDFFASKVVVWEVGSSLEVEKWH